MLYKHKYDGVPPTLRTLILLIRKNMACAVAYSLKTGASALPDVAANNNFSTEKSKTRNIWLSNNNTVDCH